MLTQDAVRQQLEAIADEISQSPGMYYELYSRLFSARVRNWMRMTSGADMALIARVAGNDPDYRVDAGMELPARNPEPILNPDWDVSY
jgi:hypothetical protein